MERWVGRVAIVTGASTGIGAGIARLLAENGLKVVGVARRIHLVQELAEEVKGCKGEIHAVQGDGSKEEDIIRVVKWTRENLGGADVLVNNAGNFSHVNLTEFDTRKMCDTMNLNVIGLSVFTREVIKDMRERGVDDGHIFHIGSAAGHKTTNYPGMYPYAASKHSVRILTEGLRTELRDQKSNTRVTEISPGNTRTDILRASGMSEENAKKVFDSAPFVLEPRDVAGSLLYALGAPPHVQIQEIIILPVHQRN